MGCFSIALKMFRNNIKTHALYLAVLVFSVAVYYEFMFLLFSPEFLQAQSMKQAAAASAAMTAFLMVVFLFFFLFYSSNFFMKQRKKEIALYLFMGVSNRKLGRVFAIEHLITGFLTLTVGIGVGVLFSRLFQMAVAKVALLDIVVKFTIPLRAVMGTVITFGILFAGLALWHRVKVARSSLIDLIRDTAREEKHVKGLWLRAIGAVLFIGAGYWLSQFLAFMVPVVVLVVIGTFWLFGAVVPLISRLLTKSPRTMYRGIRLIAISNIVFRLRSNYRSLAMMAVMTATTVTAFGTSLSLKYFVSETMHLQCPWSYSGVFNDVTKEKGIRENILASEHTLLDEVRVEIRKVPASVVDNLGTDMKFARLIRHSDLESIQASVETRYPGKSAAVPTLAEDEALYLISPATIGGAVHMKGRSAIFSAESGVAPVRFVKQDRVPLFGKGSMYQKDFVVVTDSVWDAFTGTPFEVEVFHGYAVSDGYMGEALGKELAAMLPKEAQFFSLAVRYRDEESYYGLFFFLGSFLSVVFLFATGSIYYFKVLSEGLADREKYSVLMRLGLTGKELKQAVTLQLGLSLVIPLLVGLLHSVFAVAELSSLLAYSLTTPYLWAVGVYLLCYVGINAVTTRKFLSLVQAEPGAAREMAA